MNSAKQISGLRTQYRAMFRHMAVAGGHWNVHRGSAGLVLLSEHATMDVQLPVLVANVEAMSEKTMVNAVSAALARGA